MPFPKVHLDTAQNLLDKYKGQEPFHLYLRHYFRENKKHGSTDRRIITDACYGALRLRGAFPADEKLLPMVLGGFLISERHADYFLEFMEEPWKSKAVNATGDAGEKAKQLGFDTTALFVYGQEVSDAVDKAALSESILESPLTWIRLEKEDPSMERAAPEAVRDKGTPLAFGFPPRTDLETLKVPVRFEVQDLSSQQTARYFDPEKGQRWWDCCAGSGGKTLLLRSLASGLDFYASDVRPQILESLKKRFARYGFQPRCFEADLSKEQTPYYKGFKLEANYFDRIIADVPCTGSGTWGRSPEAMHYFDKSQLQTLPEKQFLIARNASRYLKKGGKLFYITCSVFEKENEAVVKRLEADGLKLLRQEYIQGAGHRADTLFIATLQM